MNSTVPAEVVADRLGQRDRLCPHRHAGFGVEERAQAEGRHAQGLGHRDAHLCRGPERNFPPSTGRLVRYRPPELGAEGGVTARLNSGVEEGGEISVYYDPMIAKLVTHAPKRLQAIEQMSNALDAFAIDGFRHNIPFLAVLMRNERWKEGRLSTKFIAEEFPDGFSPAQPQGEFRDVLVAIAATSIIRAIKTARHHPANARREGALRRDAHCRTR